MHSVDNMVRQEVVNTRPQTASASSDFDWIDNPRTGRRSLPVPELEWEGADRASR